MKRVALILITVIALASCTQTSSPDGRAQLRDKELSQRIDALEKKQILILDSLQILDAKVKALSNQ